MTDIVISDVSRRVVYTGSAGAGPYSFTFELLDEGDIAVYVNDDLQTITTDYTVSLSADGTGSITLVTAATASDTVVLLGNKGIARSTDFVTGGDLLAVSLNEELDAQTIFNQQNKEAIDRAIKIPVQSSLSIDTTLPVPQANYILGWNDDGDAILSLQEIGSYQGTDATITTAAYNNRDLVKSTTAAQLNNIYICTAASVAGDLLTDTDHFELIVDAVTAATSATNAASSATAAASSATAAAASETAAAASESAAGTSETNAASSASAASTSATAAASSATSAASSATAAAASETAAGTSETNAAASETAAATSASNAATSETNAAGSATAASSSASAAATSATNAATSETNAATSETNAATSATSASTSATNAATSATAAAASQTAAAASAASAANSYDAFDDRYLGVKTADPTLDNDGNALVAGALYFNSTANEMRVYDGGNWIAASSAGGASLYNYNYTATASQTTFSGADDNANTLSYTVDNLIVTLNGVVLEDGTDYTATNGTSVVLTSGAASDDELNIVAFKSFTTADMVSATNGGTFSGNVDFGAGIDVTGTVTATAFTSIVWDLPTWPRTSTMSLHFRISSRAKLQYCWERPPLWISISSGFAKTRSISTSLPFHVWLTNYITKASLHISL